MNDAVRHEWERRYRERAGVLAEPCQVLTDNTHLLPRTGVALDLACGRGGNALFLARRGFTVRAWDIAPTAIAALDVQAQAEELEVHAEVHDIDTVDWDDQRFDLIVVSRYLDRALAPGLCRSLNPGGLLYYQTFTVAKLSVAGPSNPGYLLADNELLGLFAELRVRYYREDSRCGDLNAGRRDEAYFVGEKRAAVSAERKEDFHEHHS